MSTIIMGSGTVQDKQWTSLVVQLVRVGCSPSFRTVSYEVVRGGQRPANSEYENGLKLKMNRVFMEFMIGWTHRRKARGTSRA